MRFFFASFAFNFDSCCCNCFNKPPAGLIFFETGFSKFRMDEEEGGEKKLRFLLFCGALNDDRADNGEEQHDTNGDD